MMAFSGLWMPILLSTVAVFIASSVVNAVLPWHKNDFKKVPDEDSVRNALRPIAIPPGEYMVPRCLDRKEMASPEFIEKMNQGPVMMMTVFPNRVIGMGKSLGLWFVYCLFISTLVAIIQTHVFRGWVPRHAIFHMGALVAFMCYTVGVWQSSIWYGRPWSTTLKSTIDGLIYAGITGGVFAWFWYH